MAVAKAMAVANQPLDMTVVIALAFALALCPSCNLLRGAAAPRLCCDALALFEGYAEQGGDAPLDLAAEEIRIAANELGKITGRVDVEELLDVIFRDFCIGK